MEFGPTSFPSVFRYGIDRSSVVGVDSEVQDAIMMEEKDISKISTGLVVYNVRVTPETRRLLLVRDHTISTDIQYTNEVVASLKRLPSDKTCSPELTSGAGSLSVSLQGKNDLLQAKTILITKLLNKRKSSGDNSMYQEDIAALEAALASHQEIIKTRTDLLTEIIAVIFTCQRRNYIPKEFFCAPTQAYLPRPKSCTFEELIQHLETVLYNTIMRFVENSYYQACSDRVSANNCKETCANGDVSCFDCFTTSLCERVHLFRKHSYGKELISAANVAYECETYIHMKLFSEQKA